jgi:hypothetical protein
VNCEARSENAPPPPPPPHVMPGVAQTNQLSTDNSPDFQRNPGPIAVEHWLNGIERLMGALKCIDEQKVNYAGLKLTGEAE